MPRSAAHITQADIARDEPIRLVDIVKIAFPNGGMTVAGLRKERDRGRLVVEKIAGKEFTTLAAIDQMRELCRTLPKAPARRGQVRGRLRQNEREQE